MNVKGKYFVKSDQANVVPTTTCANGKTLMLREIMRFRKYLFFFYLKDEYLKQIVIDSSFNNSFPEVIKSFYTLQIVELFYTLDLNLLNY